MTLKEEQKKLFDSYKKRYGEFIISFHPHQKANWKYLNYDSQEYNVFFHKERREFPNHRYIFPDEIVVDIDCEKEHYELVAHSIGLNLEWNHINYSIWDTGGDRGFHFHFFMPFLNNYNHEDRAILKRIIIESLVPSNYWRDIDWQLCNKHLIRAEYGYYEKKYGLADLYKTMVHHKTYPDCHYNEDKAIAALEGLKARRLIRMAQNHLNDKPQQMLDNELACISFFLSEDFINLKNGRDRACFIIGTHYLKNLKKDPYEVLDLLEKYNKYNLNNKFNKEQLIGKIKSWMNTKSNPGCTFKRNLLRELGKEEICLNCPLNK